MCGTEQWDFATARKELRAIEWEKRLCRCLYRPFDVRYTVLHRGVVSNPRMAVMSQFLKSNLGLCVGRQGQAVPGTWNIVFVTRYPEDQNLFYRGGNTNFPLYWHFDALQLGAAGTCRHNLSKPFLGHLASALSVSQDSTTGLPSGLMPETIIHYAYAVLHSPGFRNRYAEFLKIDFPRIPLTGKLELFRSLARLGGDLIALHLLESPKLASPITEFVGGRNPKVEKIVWSKNTVWLDKAQTSGFKGVRDDVWNFHIGGYQVCEKWLKDRKSEALSKDDIAHYQKIVVALSETIRLVAEIDEVIAQHGGWPGAFQARAYAQEETESLLKAAEP